MFSLVVVVAGLAVSFSLFCSRKREVTKSSFDYVLSYSKRVPWSCIFMLFSLFVREGGGGFVFAAFQFSVRHHNNNIQLHTPGLSDVKSQKPKANPVLIEAERVLF